MTQAILYGSKCLTLGSDEACAPNNPGTLQGGADGKFVVLKPDGKHLAVNTSGALTETDNSGAWETFRLDANSNTLIVTPSLVSYRLAICEQ